MCFLQKLDPFWNFFSEIFFALQFKDVNFRLEVLSDQNGDDEDLMTLTHFPE